ncbi:MAG: DUF305 domain-containing protein [Leptolyngbya sp. UWPOB_LEPTO1]|uniref:DUF305 domain-containing protein n=1 Tax=Leptolyngbya sp. UWPOB_LEPTO1 TaxID=2815653 RepID=UPI001AC6CDE8|nr:DUF305 domain-containing protein [Leptolyngbya sp. UWPOB_LEPTO1]MBN8560134.1 DUF305 domain-containing protein [Leptolyngbya sp. UWPOB_LEPTO1]
MRRLIFKHSLLGLSIGAIVALGGLAACSNSAQNSTSNQNPTATGSPMAGMPGMDHSNMQHGNMQHGNMMNMDLGAADENFDLRFIDAMVPHHQGAVKMAQEALQKSKRPEIKKLAQSIIADQDKEIAQMQQWRKTWYASAASTPMAWDSKTKSMMPMTQDQMNGMMMNMDLGAADDQFDLRFINAMIPHHESAIVMANDAKQKSKRPEIQKLAAAIVSSQQAEIDQMKQWRKAWYNQ